MTEIRAVVFDLGVTIWHRGSSASLRYGTRRVPDGRGRSPHFDEAGARDTGPRPLWKRNGSTDPGFGEVLPDVGIDHLQRLPT